MGFGNLGRNRTERVGQRGFGEQLPVEHGLIHPAEGVRVDQREGESLGDRKGLDVRAREVPDPHCGEEVASPWVHGHGTMPINCQRKSVGAPSAPLCR